MRYLRYPPAWHTAAAGLPVLAAATAVSQVINNTTVWLVGILAGLATLMLTIGGVRYLMAGGDPAEVAKAKIALRSRGHRLRPGRPGAGHRHDPEVPDRRAMTAGAPGAGRLRPARLHLPDLPVHHQLVRLPGRKARSTRC